jgi:hypothetical protein
MYEYKLLYISILIYFKPVKALKKNVHSKKKLIYLKRYEMFYEFISP